MGKKSENGIGTWAEDERPREKLLFKGPAALSDAELLAILINSGTPKRSALELARETLLMASNNLTQLGRLHIADLQQIKGIGQARAITIAAAMELGRRRRITKVMERKAIDGHKEALELLFPLLQDLNTESFCVLYLNSAQHLIRHEIISNGGLTSTVADIRLILRNALLCNASRMIVGHNHPSGSRSPSKEDRKLTAKLLEAAAVMDIILLDHIIIAGTSFTSFAHEGML